MEQLKTFFSDSEINSILDVGTGSGDFMAYNLKVARVEAAVMGSGDISVYASESLKARVSGSGDISYKGNPEKQDFKTAGSGAISKS